MSTAAGSRRSPITLTDGKEGFALVSERWPWTEMHFFAVKRPHEGGHSTGLSVHI